MLFLNSFCIYHQFIKSCFKRFYYSCRSLFITFIIIFLHLHHLNLVLLFLVYHLLMTLLYNYIKLQSKNSIIYNFYLFFIFSSFNIYTSTRILSKVNRELFSYLSRINSILNLVFSIVVRFSFLFRFIVIFAHFYKIKLYSNFKKNKIIFTLI